MEVPQTKRAYDDPATRRAWRRTALFRLSAFLLSVASFPAWLFVVVMTPIWALWFLFPVVFVLLYIAMLNTVRASQALRIRRILRIYTWQAGPDAVSTAKNGTTRITMPNPDLPEKRISLRHGGWLGSGFTFWVRAVRAGAVEEVWFAGDPRFLGVIAVPGPARLLSLAQPEAINNRMSARKRGVSPEARERARLAGARVG